MENTCMVHVVKGVCIDGDEFSDNNTHCVALNNGITNITIPTNSSKLEWYSLS